MKWYIVILFTIFALGCISENPFASCNTLNETQKTECNYDIVYERNDTSVCKYLNQTEEDICYIIVATYRNDSSLCMLTHTISAADRCYYTMAAIKLDVFTCDYITNTSLLDTCRYLVSGVVECNKIPDKDLQKECMFQVLSAAPAA